MIDLRAITESTDRYCLHSHTHFCDGHAAMEEMAAGASKCGMEHYGFTPHSPIPVPSPCNMEREAMQPFFDETERLQEAYRGRMKIYRSMEIDYLGPDWGAHIDYFQRLPLDYRLSSVHFVPNQDGVAIDCDGSPERFKRYLKEGFRGDLRYVVERYFEQVLTMTERGGFEMLGHFDKIYRNAGAVDPTIKEAGWYVALVRDVVRHAADAGLVVEVNTKYQGDGMLFPEPRWWPEILQAGITMAVNSDAHYPDKIDSGRGPALALLNETKEKIYGH